MLSLGCVCCMFSIFGVCCCVQFAKDERKAQCQELLLGFSTSREDLYIPTNPSCRVMQHIPTSGTPMQSAAKVRPSLGIRSNLFDILQGFGEASTHTTGCFMELFEFRWDFWSGRCERLCVWDVVIICV